MITANAPGKMILIGEYAVLYGAKALVCAVDSYAEVKLIKSNSKSFEFSSPSLFIKSMSFNFSLEGRLQFENRNDLNVMKRLHFFSTIMDELNQIIRSKNYTIQPVKININTNDFYSADGQNKYGFGSSAAMTVALINAILTHVNLQKDYDIRDLFQLAFEIHRLAQGNLGSGIDIAASIYGNVLTYQLKHENEFPVGIGQPVNCWNELQVIPIWVGHSTSTRKMVRSVEALKDSSPEIFDQIMNKLIKCSEKGCESYIHQDKITFFESICEFNEILADLGRQSNAPIVSEAHQELINLINSSDAVYKPSGAGGGDIGVAFCESMDAVQKVRQMLKNTGFRVLDNRISEKGISITHSENN